VRRFRASSPAVVLAATAFLVLTSGAMPSTDVQVWLRDPEWSPNGRYIAFAGNLLEPTRFDDIYVMRPDGSGVRRVTENALGEGNPSWSPPSNALAFHAFDSIATVNLDGGDRRRVAEEGCCPAWAPRGRLIAFAADERINVVRTDGTAERTVVRPRVEGSTVTTPAWSPNGRRIAFAVGLAPDGGPGGPRYLGIVAATGRGKIVRVARGRSVANPAWSPDGRRIAFSDTLRYVAVVNLKTRQVRRLVRGNHPSWSPNGKQLVFVRDGEIYVARANGSQVRRIVPDIGNVGGG
jgi:Tol biopolymer transport system component